MGRLSDKAKAKKEGVTDRAIRKRRKAAVDKAKKAAAKTQPEPETVTPIDPPATPPEVAARIDGEEADRRWRVARANIAEDKLAAERGLLVLRSEVVTETARCYATAKALLLAIPGQLAVRYGVSAEAVQGAEELIKNACEELHTKWKQ